jgi:hypothetical protein
MKLKIKLKKVNLKTLPTPVVAIGAIFLSAISFTLGTVTHELTNPNKNSAQGKLVEFTQTKVSDKPKFEFYVMSFCPFGNQAETTLRPIQDLLGDKIDLVPHYIFDRAEGNLSNYCKERTGDPAKCAEYIAAGAPFTSVEQCREQVNKYLTPCLNEKSYIKIGTNYYTSLHGRIEANQNIREVCALKQGDKTKWWNFVGAVNKNCTQDNADTCWEQQAKDAGLDVTAITTCFNQDAKKIMDDEIAATSQYRITASPSFVLNGQQFPPESIIAATSEFKIGKKKFTPAQIRTPEAIKSAICATMQKAPKECKTELSSAADTTGTAQGGCE